MLVTIRAYARLAPSIRVADLGRSAKSAAMLDKQDIRGLLKVAAIVCVAAGIGLFVSAFGDRGGMKKDKASGRIYYVQASASDPSLLRWAYASFAAGAALTGLIFARPLWD